MNKSLLATVQFQVVAILLLIQAEKEGWDKDPSWVKRGKNGQFGGGSGDGIDVGKKMSKLISDVEKGNKKLQKDFVKISRENQEKILDFTWSDEAKKSRQDIAKTLDKYLPGAGKSFEESVDFINKEVIDRSDPRWDKFLFHSFERGIGRLKRRVLNQSTPIDRIDDAIDVVAGIVASTFTVGVASLMFKAATIPIDIGTKTLEFEYKTVGSLYLKALQSDDPGAYIRNLNIVAVAGAVTFYGLLIAATFPIVIDAVAFDIKGINSLFDKNIAPKIEEGFESVQKDVRDKWRSQQSELNSKLLTEA